MAKFDVGTGKTNMKDGMDSCLEKQKGTGAEEFFLEFKKGSTAQTSKDGKAKLANMTTD